MIDFIKKLFSQEGKVKDPVCGMMIDQKTAKFHSLYQDKHFYFCSESCKKQFDEKPENYS